MTDAPPTGTAQLRVGLAQVDTTVGDLAGNAALVSHWVGQAAGSGVHLVVFPEMTLTGYMPEDLVLRPSFVAASCRAVDALALRLAAEGHGNIAVAVGYCGQAPRSGPRRVGVPVGAPQNALAVLWRGRMVATYAKHHLPNYGVFDEARYFVRGDSFPVLRLHGVDIGLTICEDLWQEGGPVAVAARAGVGLLLCVNGSPYERGKLTARTEMVARRAREAGATIAYVNLVAGQDEIVYDGASLVVDPAGVLLAQAPQFDEGLMLVDLALPAGVEGGVEGPVDASDGTSMTVSRRTLSADRVTAYAAVPAGTAEPLDEEEEIWQALVLGTRDYVDKNDFRSVVLGLSGGIDSAVTATVAVDALGGDRVHTVAMPSAYSSQHSLDDAAELARRQGTQHDVVPIADVVSAFESAVLVSGLAEENLQARVRGTTLMALSNQLGHLVLTTGNKSELATGFSTLYGDSAGGFAPLKDVPKSVVWRLARWRNAVAAADGVEPPIPAASIDKPPSAELAPGQLDADRLPAYDVLDAVLDDYIEGDLGRDELVRRHDPEVVDRVVRLVDLAEYKRRQYPPGPKITPRAFGRDRRLPITSRWRETPPPPPPAQIRPEQAS